VECREEREREKLYYVGNNTSVFRVNESLGKRKLWILRTQKDKGKKK